MRVKPFQDRFCFVISAFSSVLYFLKCQEEVTSYDKRRVVRENIGYKPVFIFAPFSYSKQPQANIQVFLSDRELKSVSPFANRK